MAFRRQAHRYVIIGRANSATGSTGRLPVNRTGNILRRTITRLPSVAAELVRLKVAVNFAGGGGRAQPAAKAATTTIPIVFNGGFDPFQAGLVPRLYRPVVISLA
jgi:hypothetical protein